MTTKKQRRANVAAKNEAQRALQKADNAKMLEALNVKRQMRIDDAARAKKKRDAAAAIKAVAEAKKSEAVPENLEESFEAATS